MRTISTVQTFHCPLGKLRTEDREQSAQSVSQGHSQNLNLNLLLLEEGPLGEVDMKFLLANKLSISDVAHHLHF